MNNTDFNDVAAVQGNNALSDMLSRKIAEASYIQPAANDAGEINSPGTSNMNDAVASQNGAASNGGSGAKFTLQNILGRFAKIMKPGKLTNNIFDTYRHVEYTKTQFQDIVGDKKLVSEWLKHEKCQVIDMEQVRNAQNKAKSDYSDDMLKRFIKISGTKEAWDLERQQAVALEALKSDFPLQYEGWLNCPSRRNVFRDRIVFDPTLTIANDETYVNTYTGMPLKPLDVSYDEAYDIAAPILELAHHLCENDNKTFLYLMRWLAIPLQQVGTKMATAWLFHGEKQGAGKSRFFELVKRIYGDYGITLGQHQLESQYNDWSSSKLFAIFEEIFSGKEKHSNMGLVKQMITGETTYINKKFMSGWEERNYVNCIFLSNDLIPMYLENDDRRHNVCWPKKKLPVELNKRLTEALDDPKDKCLRAFYTVLLNTKLGDQHAHTPAIMTTSKMRLITLSKPSWERFYDEWSYDTKKPHQKRGLLDWPYQSCITSDLYQAYRFWCNQAGERATTRTKFLTFIGLRERKSRKRVNIRSNAEQKTVVIIGSMPNAYQDEQQWLSKEVSDFQNRLRRSEDYS